MGYASSPQHSVSVGITHTRELRQLLRQVPEVTARDVEQSAEGTTPPENEPSEGSTRPHHRWKRLQAGRVFTRPRGCMPPREICLLPEHLPGAPNCVVTRSTATADGVSTAATPGQNHFGKTVGELKRVGYHTLADIGGQRGSPKISRVRLQRHQTP